jgi:predicted DNA-binding transcriptional regulator AlpA
MEGEIWEIWGQTERNPSVRRRSSRFLFSLENVPSLSPISQSALHRNDPRRIQVNVFLKNIQSICYSPYQMEYSTVQAAKKLGISMMSMHRYMRAKKIPVPKMHRVLGVRVRVWTDEDIEKVRQLLPKIANGRKTRYKKKQVAISNSQLAKKKSNTKSKKKT